MDMNTDRIDYRDMDGEELAVETADRRALHVERLSRLLTKAGHWHRLREKDDWLHHLTVEYDDRQFELEVFPRSMDVDAWWSVVLRDGDEYRSSDLGRIIARISVRETDNAPLLEAIEQALPSSRSTPV